MSKIKTTYIYDDETDTAELTEQEEIRKRKEKSELERIKKFMYDIKYGLTTYDKLKIMVEICCVASVSPVDCWQGFVYFGEERNKIYETDVSDLEYTMEKIRNYIERNFKTELD